MLTATLASKHGDLENFDTLEKHKLGLQPIHSKMRTKANIEGYLVER